MAYRFDRPGMWGEGLTVLRQGRPGWSGKVVLVPEKLSEPLSWRKPRRVFPCSGSDLFHEKIPFEYIAAAFAVMAAASQHTFQVLTKRPERMREFLEWLVDPKKGSRGYVWQTLFSCAIETDPGLEEKLKGRMGSPWPWPLPNVWLGVSVEDQARFDERVPELLKCDAAVRWLSCEPLLGRVNLDLGGVGRGIGWVVPGGESGDPFKTARPCAMEWIAEIKDECLRHGVPVFVKQLGSVAVSEERMAASVAEANELRRAVGHTERDDPWLWMAGLADYKGEDPAEWPDEFQVRLFPGDEVPPPPEPQPVNEECPF
jgi:protein gp37